MECQQLAAGEVRKYLNAEMLRPELFALAGGTAAILSTRRPEKSTANEDAAAIVAVGEQSAVLIVADGCGGMANGEAAARIAIDAISDRVCTAEPDGAALRAAILDGVEEANRQILELKAGAGCTLAVVQLENGEARPYHIGDAQILQVGSRGKIKLFTTSHSPVGYAFQSGYLDEQEAIDHEERHLVSNFLGSEEMHVEMGSGRPLAGLDGLLVASDGVLDNIMVEELVGLLKTGSAAESATKIAALAAKRMAAPLDGEPHKPDDMTLIVFSKRKGRARALRKRRQTISDAPSAVD